MLLSVSKRDIRKPSATPTALPSSQPTGTEGTEPQSGQPSMIQRSPELNNESLQPAELYNRAVTRGNFSLRSILNASESHVPELRCRDPAICEEDPVQSGVVNLAIASSLFEK